MRGGVDVNEKVANEKHKKKQKAKKENFEQHKVKFVCLFPRPNLRLS